MWIATQEDLQSLVEQFEAGTLSEDRWDHAAHITIALYYLQSLPLVEAIRRIKSGILRFNAHRGIPNSSTSGYHETLTSFWISVLAAECAREPKSDLHVSVLRIAHRLSGSGEIWRRYYSHDMIRDPVARRHWIEPDLCALPNAAAICPLDQ